MASGDVEKDYAKVCLRFKGDLKDALDQLDAISRSGDLAPGVTEQTKTLQKIVGDAQDYTEKHRYFFMDAESLPKRP